MSTKLVPIQAEIADVEEVESEPNTVALGTWYWLKVDHKEAELHDGDSRLLVCVTKIGSNFAEVTSRAGSRWRVHFDNFDEELTIEPTHAPVIARYVRAAKLAVRGIMTEINEVTRELGIDMDPTPQLGTGNETRSLVVASENRALDDYKAELKRGKEALPKLFDRLEQSNKALVSALKMETIGLRAGIVEQSDIVKAIDARAFNIELYAGLTENVVQIRDGVPAPRDTKLSVRQRMLYMDEECIAHYRAGGMRFDSIDLFDEWIAEPEQLANLLPEPRCVVAFRVRRRDAPCRDGHGLEHCIRLMYERENDKRTYLYIRNGEQLYRIETAMDFGERLFPDLSRSVLDEPMMARDGWSTDREPVPVREWEAMRDAYRAEQLAEREVNIERTARRVADGQKPWPFERVLTDEQIEANVETWEDGWVAFTPETVWYDDIAAAIRKDVDHYNRVALILQGLFDRSTMLHPHPPVKTWDAAGFAAAIDLVYDMDDALTPPDKPDWHAYQKRCNATIKAGSITVGQNASWHAEQEKEFGWGERTDWKKRDFFASNPGPTDAGPVHAVYKKRGTLEYKWTRSPRSWRTGRDNLPARGEVPIEDVLNVDEYQLGDFRRFFADPRTRAEYMKWARFLLAAEDYKAGRTARPKSDPGEWSVDDGDDAEDGNVEDDQ